MTDQSLSRRLAQEADFELGQLRVSPSTGRVLVDGQEIRLEALTMAVLTILAGARGATVSREDLVEACWQGRIVSDDAVSRAIAKVRAVAKATEPAAFALETLPKIGYRLLSTDAQGATDAWKAAANPRRPAAKIWSWLRAHAALVAGGAVVGIALIAAPLLINQATAGMAVRSERPSGVEDSGKYPAVRAAEFLDALLVLDEDRLRFYLQRGWNPNWKLDSEGNAALHDLMMVCERNRFHDRKGVVRVARMLVEAGANPTARNKWNDTPLSIAATPRYCGPDHPVVAYLNTVVG